MANNGDSGTRNSLLITNARIIDGNGMAPDGYLRSIRIEDGRIAEIAHDPTGGEGAASAMRVLDAGGATVMPGLVDSYVLLQNSPGSVYRGDTDEDADRLRVHHLRAYLACGVTTVVNAEIGATTLRKMHDYLTSGGVGPRVYALAPTFYPPGGYLDSEAGNDFGNAPLEGAVSSRADVEARFSAFEGLEERILGVTVLLEPGNGGIRIWPVHSPEMRKVLAEEAAQRDLPVFYQASRPKEHRAALDMGARGSLIPATSSKTLVSAMRERGVYQGTTVSGFPDSIRTAFRPERLDDDLVRLVVPEEVISTAADPVAWKTILADLYGTVSPAWWPSAWSRTVSRFLYTERTMSTFVDYAMKCILRAHSAGVPTAIGSKGGCLPPFLGAFHGVSTIHEIELLREAGMAPMDALVSATRTPAEMLRIDDLVGTVEVGKRADLIVIGDDPLEDPTALRKSIRYTIRDGDARTPEEWMRVASTPATMIRLKDGMAREGIRHTTETPQEEETSSSPTPAV